MKKNIIIIDVHSFVDVITNSSSELFVVGGSNSVETIKEMLAEMLRYWNEMAAKGLFGSHYVRNSRHSLVDGKLDPKPLKSFEDVFGDIYIYSEERCNADIEEIEKWKSPNSSDISWGYEKRENIGKIIIESESDNSIPYEMFDWIESAFSCSRYHLG